MAIARQIELNQETAQSWELYASHRKAVTARALSSLGGQSRLCVLGAGNCNDLDLSVLAASCGEIHLADLDEAALRQGIARQGESGSCSGANLVVHAPVDISGIFSALRPGMQLSASMADDLARRAANPPELDLRGPHDVVLSSCVLSQLVFGVITSIGERHPRCLDIIRAVREAHLRLLVRSIAPGGAGILVSDVVSSDTTPLLAQAPESHLPALLKTLVANGNFFTGLNPFLIESKLRTEAPFASAIEGVELHAPWRWRLSQSRTYLVYAITFRRRQG